MLLFSLFTTYKPHYVNFLFSSSRYVLVAQKDVREPHAQATAMEETLLMLRFPKSRVRKRHTSATIPRLHSNRNVRVQTGYEM